MFQAFLTILILHFFGGSFAFAQSYIGYASPPLRSRTLQIDTRAEEPPVNSGVISTPLPRAGATVNLQIFLPEAIGKQAFSYIVEFDNPGLLFSDYFRIQDAKTWVRLPFLNPTTNRTEFIRRSLPLQTPRGSQSTGRSILFLTAPIVPPGGLIATLTLEALKNIPPNLPLRVTVTVTVMSTTAPARFWKYQGVRTVRWS